jgi:hypothetical protein
MQSIVCYLLQNPLDYVHFNILFRKKGVVWQNIILCKTCPTRTLFRDIELLHFSQSRRRYTQIVPTFKMAAFFLLKETLPSLLKDTRPLSDLDQSKCPNLIMAEVLNKRPCLSHYCRVFGYNVVMNAIRVKTR